MFRLALDLKVKAGARAWYLLRVPKSPTIEFLGQMIPYRKISRSRSGRIRGHIDSRFAFEFQDNRPPGTGWNDALFWWMKSARAVFSLFCARLAESVKNLQECVPPEPTSPRIMSSTGLPKFFPNNVFRATAIYAFAYY